MCSAWLKSCLLVLFSLFLSVAHAGNSLPAQQVAFGGSFETTDFQNAGNCVNPNGHTFACSCPGGTAPKFSLRVINDSGGGNVNFCSSGAPAGSSEFYGVYQIDDAVAGGIGCRKANALTGSCSCPAGTYSEHMQTLVDTAGGTFINSNIYMCMKATSSWTSFGGVFQKDDNNSCRAPNQYTGGCSCPANFSAVTTRVLVNGSGGQGGSTIYTCYPPAQSVQICPGQTADPTGRVDASTAINACISQTVAGGTLELPAGTYLLNTGIIINKAMTLKTSLVALTDEPCGNSTPCATFVASPTFSAANGLLATTSGLTGVTIDHIVLNGNRFARLSSAAANTCRSTDPLKAPGFNANIQNCKSCKLTNSVSTRALCGTGMSFVGDKATISNNTFSYNGDHPSMVADGLTFSNATAADDVNSSITNNKFIDNTDVGLIMGSAKNGTITGNVVTQSQLVAYVGIMLDNFAGNWPGNYVGATVSGNTVNCAVDKCFYAVQIGAHTWYASPPTLLGGSVINNTITGGFFGINIDGAGTSTYPLTVANNTISGWGTALGAYTCPSTGAVFTPGRINRSPHALLSASSTPVSPSDTAFVTDGYCYGR